MNKYLTKIFQLLTHELASGKFRAILLLLTVLTISTYGTAMYWTNTLGGVFSDAENWNPQTAPETADYSYFQEDGNYTVQFIESVTNEML